MREVTCEENRDECIIARSRRRHNRTITLHDEESIGAVERQSRGQ